MDMSLPAQQQPRRPSSRGSSSAAQPSSSTSPTAPNRRMDSQISRISTAATDSTEETDGGSEVTAPAQTIRDVSQAFRSGRPSPYHMAVVTLLGSLASGMPLASMFKVYTYIMCEVYDPTIRDEPVQRKTARAMQVFGTLLFSSPTGIDEYSASATLAAGVQSPSTLMKLPPAPELPNPPRCSLPWVQKSTSSYSAAMVTVGALLGLMTLSRASAISKRFGRKPLLVISHIVIAVAILVFRLAVVLPPLAGAAVLYCAVVISEASAGAPLRIAIQNYVVDTTSEAQRAGALSFIEGFGQIGAFPSSALGGLLASITGEFFAPFYADCGLMVLAIVYLLLIVPESKNDAEHTFVDNWFHSDDVERDAASETNSADAGSESNSPSTTRERPADGGHEDDPSRDRSHSNAGSNATWSSAHTAQDTSKLKWRSRLRAMNFLRPLAIFWPRPRHYSPITAEDIMDAPVSNQTGPPEGPPADFSSAVQKMQSRIDFRLLNLAAVVVFEETYQAFMVPLLLLYNSERFGFDVLQNGYLISILQSTRALFLTAIFPPGVALARRYVAKMGLARRKRHIKKLKAEARQRRKAARADAAAGQGGQASTSKLVGTNTGSSSNERTPLVRGTPSGYGSVAARDYGLGSQTNETGQGTGTGPGDSQASLIEARPARRRPSYKAAASLGYSDLKRNKGASGASGITINSHNWETHSIFTNPPSELIKKIQRGKLDISIMVVSYLLSFTSFLILASSAKAPSASPRPSHSTFDSLASDYVPLDVAVMTSDKLWWKTPWIPLVISIVLLQLSSGSTSVRTALVVNAVSEEDQTKALAAHQILVTVVAAVVPLLTSLVFGAALERGHPELVWLFKAIFAALAAVGASALFWTHRGFYEKAHDEEDDGHDDSDDDDDEEDGRAEDQDPQDAPSNRDAASSKP
ncbi:hypothetical protein BCV70DRAFT_199183 [Testicularia cyperi]|uniref:MFS general substrate transporter n=1 Tax=Testicularia cyperi TaxID=1882483 RepID=A0A317XWS0_9BASI|nr:hypothetical protein BCV70DRAFT_199183 [Testicularia cyperi]